MVCAIRPGHLYYEETLNTLKYADRAKKIKNKPTINESPQDKLIRELMEENKRLKAGLGGGVGNDPEAAKKLQDAEENIRKNQAMMDEMNKSWEQRLKESEGRDAE
jgi:kinesin family protein 16B